MEAEKITIERNGRVIRIEGEDDFGKYTKFILSRGLAYHPLVQIALGTIKSRCFVGMVERCIQALAEEDHDRWILNSIRGIEKFAIKNTKEAIEWAAKNRCSAISPY